jgi:hypothetical protein
MTAERGGIGQLWRAVVNGKSGGKLQQSHHLRFGQQSGSVSFYGQGLRARQIPYRYTEADLSNDLAVADLTELGLR